MAIRRLATITFVTLFLALFVACSGRERINSACEWTQDPRLKLDLTRRSHRTHLRHDADLMEDLAIRYADKHAGRVARPEWAQARDACTSKLLALVTDHHGVSEATIRLWTGRRNLVFDLAVFLSFLMWVAWISRAVVQRLFNAWSFTGPPAAIASVLVVLVVAAVGGASGAFWAGAWEVIRLGSEHLSHRANRMPWPYYIPTLFTVAFTACAAFGWYEYRTVKRSLTSSDSERVDRLLFR